jgi:uncharacterized membrane protein
MNEVRPTPAQSLDRAQQQALLVARGCWIALLLLLLAWELWLAPLRPGGSALALKALPVLVLVPGVWRGGPAPMQWALMLVLLYVCEAGLRFFEPPPVAWLAAAEGFLATGFFVAAIVYLRPMKRAAKARASEARANEARAAERRAAHEGAARE